MKPKLYLPLLLSLLALWLPQHASGQIEGAPSRIDYQGHVLDSAGNPLSPGTATNYTMEFRIYGAQTGGTALWAESQTVTVSDGDFSVRLGEGVIINGLPRPDLATVFNQRERFLGITVVIPGQTPGEIVPRLAFLSAPYSLAAERAKTAESVTQVAGNSTLGTTTIFNLTVAGPTNVSGNNVMQFGAGVPGKEPNAGKIGYQVFTHNALDIVGAGTGGSDRRLKVWAEGGTEFTGNVSTTGTISAGLFSGGNVSGTFSGNGANITSLNGGNLTNNSVDIAKLAAAVQQALCPVGTILPYAGDTPPTGWLLCDGSPVARLTYPALFSVIGTRFGNPNVAQFNLPDFRGRFMRGRDAFSFRDPDRTSRIASAPGGSTGDLVGSLQFDDFRSHRHSWVGSNGQASPASTDFSANEFGAKNQTEQTGFSGGNETRPVNVYVNYIIKI